MAVASDGFEAQLPNPKWVLSPGDSVHAILHGRGHGRTHFDGSLEDLIFPGWVCDSQLDCCDLGRVGLPNKLELGPQIRFLGKRARLNTGMCTP